MTLIMLERQKNTINCFNQKISKKANPIPIALCACPPNLGDPAQPAGRRRHQRNSRLEKGKKEKKKKGKNFSKVPVNS